ncbi:prepilin-type processing-associated H-X9-DG protein [Rossellomorea marisflavi]
MMYTFQRMNQKEAEEIAYSWKYDGVYSFYDMTADEEDLREFIDDKTRGEHVFSSYVKGELAGFITLDVLGETIDIGLGLKPDWTGKGKGRGFLQSAISFIKSRYAFHALTLSVASFNQRAISLYSQMGFVRNGTFLQKTNGGEYEFIRMILPPENGIMVSRAFDKSRLEEIQEVYHSVGWNKHSLDVIEEIYLNSNVVSILYVDGHVRGLGRALSDGVFNAAIYDVVIHGEAHGHGLGACVMDDLLDQLRDVSCVHLIATTGNEKFYQKKGLSPLRTGMARYKSEALEREYLIKKE